MKTFHLVLSLVALFVGSQAMAFSIAPVAGLNFTKEVTTPASTTEDHSAAAGLSYGVLVELPMFMPMLNLETGFLMANEKSTRTSKTTPADKTELSIKYIKIPLMLNVEFAHFFSLGGGFWYAMAQGDLEATVTQSGITQTVKMPLKDAGMKTSNYGLGLGATFMFPVIPTTKLIAKLGYDIGLADLNDPSVAGGSSKTASFEMLAGVSFGL